MATNPPNLWPDISPGPRAPITVLKEQANLLAEKTSGILRAETLSTAVSDKLVHQFFIVAPALNYRYFLFTAFHRVTGYPVTIARTPPRDSDHPASPDTPKFLPRVAKDEAALLAILRQIFNSDRTKQVLSSLLSQSGAP